MEKKGWFKRTAENLLRESAKWTLPIELVSIPVLLFVGNSVGAAFATFGAALDWHILRTFGKDSGQTRMAAAAA